MTNAAEQSTTSRTAILIDPSARTVTEVPYTGDLDQFKSYIGGDRITSLPVMNAGAGGYLDEDDYWVEGENPIPGLTFSDTFLLDEGALFCDDRAFFKTPLHCDPIAGKALIVGTDDEGRSASPEVTLEQVREHVKFLGMTL